MTRESDSSEPGRVLALKPMQVITIKNLKIIPQKLSLSGTVKAVSMDPGQQKTGQNAFIFHLFEGNQSKAITLWDRQSDAAAVGSCVMDGL